jgi:hypothetical protein
MMTRNVTFILPDREEAYTLTIRLGGNEIMEPITSPPGQNNITLELTGNGPQIYELFINGELYRTEEVMFAND